MARVFALIAALALAGCGKDGGQVRMMANDTDLADPGKVDSRYSAIANDPDLAEPGEYRETWETRIEVPGHVPRVEEKVDTNCLKSGDDPVRKKVTERFGSLCEGPALRFANGQISGELSCRSSSSSPDSVPVLVSGSYNRRRVELVTDTHYQGASIRQIRTYERLGDCESAAEAIARDPWSATENHEAAAQ